MASISQVLDPKKKAYGDTPTGKDRNPFGFRPLQYFKDEDEKDFEWYARNIDWLEWQGVIQIYYRSRKYLKNYKLAAGVLDKSDYLPEYDDIPSEYSNIVNMLLDDYKQSEISELKFYPLIPVIINVLTDEFFKRNTDITYKAIDEWSVSEILDNKKAQIEQIVKEWIDRMVNEISESLQEGEQIAQEKAEQIKKQLIEDINRRFPEIEDYFARNHKLNIERLAEKFHEYDRLRMKLDELLYNLFKDFLITGSMFVEFVMTEDNYYLQSWNPMFTFFKRSQFSPFISNGEWVGKIELMSLNDVISRYGKWIKEETIEYLQNKYGITTATMGDPNFHPSAYFKQGVDTLETIGVSKTGGLDFQREMFWRYPFYNVGDYINKLFYSSEDAKSVWYNDLLRVVTVYWKTIKKVGVVTKIDPFTKVKSVFIVDSKYKPVIEPIYDLRFGKSSKTADNLLSGEHVDWFLIPYVVGGVKIAPNVPTFYKSEHADIPIYIGINSQTPGPIEYQFVNSEDLYSCKLPVEGYIYTERNTQSMSLVDLAKPYQIAYNIVNNQIMDMLLDEIGSIILIDQNTIPKTSLEEDAGSNPLLSMYNMMKKYKILPIDTSLSNTGQPINFNQFQQMVLEHSPRIKSRIELALYFQQKLYETLGLTPERMGRPTSEYQSGKASEINVVNSYSTTEKYFTIFGDMFLPRLHEMRNSVLFYYLGSGKLNEKILTYFTDKYERETINIEKSEDFLLSKFGVYITNRTGYKIIIDQIKQMLFNNPNLGMTLTDAVEILNTNKQSDLLTMVKKLEEKAMMQQQMEMQAKKEEKMLDIQSRMQEIELTGKIQNEMLDKKIALERERIKSRLLEAQINSARYMASLDLNKNSQSDYIDFLNTLMSNEKQAEELYNKTIEKVQTIEQKNKLLEYKQKELDLRQKLKQMDLEIAKIYENKE